MKYIVTIAAMIGLSACAEGAFLGGRQTVETAGVATGASVSPDLSPPIHPSLNNSQTRPDLPPSPPPNARTVEQFDTTTAQDRAAAIAPPAGGERRLGSTIANLGSPTDPGIWLKTPLVTAVMNGRVEYNGMSVNLELRPSGGALGSGSQISLAAMRLIEAPLFGLPEVGVYAN
jgi:hypothetical protein